MLDNQGGTSLVELFDTCSIQGRNVRHCELRDCRASGSRKKIPGLQNSERGASPRVAAPDAKRWVGTARTSEEVLLLQRFYDDEVARLRLATLSSRVPVRQVAHQLVAVGHVCEGDGAWRRGRPAPWAT